jgi:oligopeptide transport system ATP-binding protein
MNGTGAVKLVEAEGLVKNFDAAGGFRGAKRPVQAVSGVSFHIDEGETLALVGESGCGKSTVGRLVLRLIEPSAGAIRFEGRDLAAMNAAELRAARRRMQIIFQDPYASLNPRMTVRKTIAEPLVTHKIFAAKDETEERVKELMRRVGLRPEHINRYPHQFSGGQRQRIGIARALALNPKLIVCDEPVSALDVSIQAQILNLLCDLQRETGMAYLFISHDLGVVRHISDRVCVMFLGRLCETADAKELFANPLHPYTKFLLDAAPQPDPRLRKEKKSLLSGEMPSPMNPPAGCRFHTRCPYSEAVCENETPPMIRVSGREVACHMVK